MDSASMVFLAPDASTPPVVLNALANAADNVVELRVKPGRYAFTMAVRDDNLDPDGEWDGVLVGECVEEQ